MINYDRKKRYLYDEQDGICTICGEPLSDGRPLSLDHKYFHNKKHFRKLYPNAIDSVYNLQLVHNDCNINKRKRDKMPESEFKALDDRMESDLEFYKKSHCIRSGE